MTARPGRWELLDRDGDPVPGDPGAVGDEATYYGGVAQAIGEQVARLRALARPDESLQGRYAEGLQESCSKLAGHLEDAHDRFATTARQLTVLEPALASARTTTGSALEAAEDADRRMRANEPSPLPAGAEVEPAQRQAHQDAEDAKAARYGAARQDLDGAKGTCTSAMNRFNGVAEDVASAIRKAADDDLKDSRWDGFKEFVHGLAPVISFIADGLSIVATVLTIAALFIPGINLLVIAALLGGALLLHSLLAATGEGSWLDVGLDAFGVMTLGLGSVATSLARAGRAVTLSRLGTQAANRAASQVFTRAAFNGGRGALGQVSLAVVKRLPWVKSRAAAAYADELARVLNRGLPEVSVLQKVSAGLDESVAALSRDLSLLRGTYGARAIDPSYDLGVAAALAALRTSAVVDGVTKGLSFSLGPFTAWEVPFYGDLKNRLKVEVGGPW